MKKLKTNIPIFHGFLYVFITNNHRKILNRYKQDTNDKTNYWGATNISTKNKKGVTVYILTIRKDHLTTQTIAHESLHIVNRILLDRDIPVSYHDDEIECYLLGWVVKKISKLI